MNWVKTYESFIYEGSTNPAIEVFEETIGFTKGTGIVTGVEYDPSKKLLTIDVLPKLSSFDLGGLMNAIDKAKSKIKKEYGAKQVQVGNTAISL